MPILGDLCSLIVDSEHKTAPKSEAGHPMIRTPDIGLGRLNLDRVQQVDEETYQQWTRRAVPVPGDLILAREAPVGNVGIVLPGMEPCLGQRTVLLRPDRSKVDPHYLNFLLSGPEMRGRMDALSNGATVPHLNMKDIRALALPELPDRGVQVRIGSVLAAYDELIENNTRRILILEEMAQAIYREWFVELRYPGHEEVPLAGSDLGPIPAGWAWTTLGDAARWFSGGTPSTKVSAYWHGDTPWMTSGSMTSFQLDRSERRLTPEGIEAGSRLVQRDAVLLVVRGMSLAKEFRMGIADVPLAFGQDCKALLATTVAPLFLAHAIKAQTDQVLGMVQYAAHGTGLIPTDRLKALVIPQPSTRVQAEFVDAVGPMRELTSNLRAATDALRSSRELLLPRLISGEVDVSGLDIDVGDAAA